MTMVLGSLVSPVVKGLVTNSTTASFTAAMSIPTITEPVASDTRTIIDRTGNYSTERVTLKVQPYGGNDNDDVVNVKVIGWQRVQSQTGLPSVLWKSAHVCEVAATLSSSLLGIAGMAMVATEFFADTLSLTTGFAVLHTGTANIGAAWFECDVSCWEKVEILYSKGSGGDTANCFWWF